MEQCIFDQWYNGELKNVNKFMKSLFDTFIFADGSNREKLKIAFPEYFEGVQSF